MKVLAKDLKKKRPNRVVFFTIKQDFVYRFAVFCVKHFARDEVVNRLDEVHRSFQVEIRPLVCTCSQLLLFIPPSPKTPYFSIQKLSLASSTNGSELLIFSKGRKLKSATSCPGRLKCFPTPVSQ